ncbi:MAG: M14 family metallopeptidase [Bacteroidetes bacterium]|nr:M14 family metallopeptidase [Bacteroidota bacterium]
MKKNIFFLFLLSALKVFAQTNTSYHLKLSTTASLPPPLEWKGKSETLIADAANPWITTCEKSDFKKTPSYAETMAWFKKLADASPLISMQSIGKSVEGRDIFMLIASADKNTSAVDLKSSSKPLLFVQAGIHAGEIDGKDAGMMLFRDIAFGGKQSLLDKVNFLFIPILNVDGHERSSAYNRPNQRGPESMGYRTNAQNLNLNRDYTKLDTKEIRAVIQVINEYNPLLYMDIHVTDGADYQYDITYGCAGKQGYSPAISNWVLSTYTPAVNAGLKAMGHVPGPFINGMEWNDLSGGIVDVLYGPNFSTNYGDLRHLPTLLVENHSLKPYKQRVLGTYVLLENTLKVLAQNSQTLLENKKLDEAIRINKIPVEWKVPQQLPVDAKLNSDATPHYLAADSFNLQGVSYQKKKSEITGAEYIEWTGKAVNSKIAFYEGTEIVNSINCAKRYWVPAACVDVIERLKLHGIKMELINTPKEVAVEMYRMSNPQFLNSDGQVLPFEGRMLVNATTTIEKRNQVFPTGSACISTDQSLGELAALLLEPNAPNSLFRWGFFMSIFHRTEYIEAYVMEPLIKKMLDESVELKKEFEAKKSSDANFAKNQTAIYEWFYSKSKYYDERYLLYPVGREN